jgi:hypothetical protein
VTPKLSLQNCSEGRGFSGDSDVVDIRYGSKRKFVQSISGDLIISYIWKLRIWPNGLRRCTIFVIKNSICVVRVSK